MAGMKKERENEGCESFTGMLHVVTGSDKKKKGGKHIHQMDSINIPLSHTHTVTFLNSL